jgi:hypothetical protein
LNAIIHFCKIKLNTIINKLNTIINKLNTKSFFYDEIENIIQSNSSNQPNQIYLLLVNEFESIKNHTYISFKDLLEKMKKKTDRVFTANFNIENLDITLLEEIKNETHD